MCLSITCNTCDDTGLPAVLRRKNNRTLLSTQTEPFNPARVVTTQCGSINPGQPFHFVPESDSNQAPPRRTCTFYARRIARVHSTVSSEKFAQLADYRESPEDGQGRSLHTPPSMVAASREAWAVIPHGRPHRPIYGSYPPFHTGPMRQLRPAMFRRNVISTSP